MAPLVLLFGALLLVPFGVWWGMVLMVFFSRAAVPRGDPGTPSEDIVQQKMVLYTVHGVHPTFRALKILFAGV